MKYLRDIWKSKNLRTKILVTLGLIGVYKILTNIPVPGANHDVLHSLMERAQTLGALSALLGGGLENFSVVLMGLSPYINASIIIQLLTVIIPKMEAISKDGQRGQKLINKYTRWLALPLAFFQSYGMILLLNSYNVGQTGLAIIDEGMLIPAMITVTAGTMFLMWLAEVITEKGIGNGTSMIIFASIVSAIPSYIINNLSLTAVDDTKIYSVILLVVVTILLLVFVIWFTEAQRNVPVTYAEHGKKGVEKSSLPIRLNQAGMVPIIFAVSMVTFPSIIAQLMQLTSNQTLRNLSDSILRNFNPQSPTFWYVLIYFLLVVFFAYFYVSIIFKPEQVAENIQKRGGFIAGVRPGNETVRYLSQTSNRLTLWGGLFIALVAVFPYAFDFFTSETGSGSVQLLISGAGLIIIVGVVLDVLKKLKVEMVTKDYDKFY